MSMRPSPSRRRARRAKRKQDVLDVKGDHPEDWAPLMNLAAPTLYSSYNKRVGGYDPTIRGAQGFKFSEFIKG